MRSVFSEKVYKVKSEKSRDAPHASERFNDSTVQQFND